MDAVANLSASAITNTPGTSGTTITVNAPIWQFPAAPFTALCWVSGTLPTISNAELVRVTATNGIDTLTVTRAQGGTTAKNLDTTYTVAQTVDKDLLRSLQAYSGVLTSGTRTITVPSTTAYLITSQTGGIFTLNNSGASVSVAPGASTLLVGNSSDTQITVSAQTLPAVTLPTTATLSLSQAWSGVAANTSGTWVAVAATAGTTANVSTNNGSTWAASTMSVSGTYYGIAYGNNIWVTANGTSTNTQVYNGTSWAAGAALPASSTWRNVAYGNVGGTTPTFVVSANSATTPAWSTNPQSGGSWTAGTGVGVATWAIAYGNNKFMTLAYNGQGVYTSTNGQTWTSVGNTLPVSTTWVALTYANGRWIAASVGNSSIAVSMNDGATWTTIRPDTGTNGASAVAAYGGGYFITGFNGVPYLLYSADGFNWQSCYANAAPGFNGQGVAYATNGTTGYWVSLANGSTTTAYQWTSPQIYPVHYTITPTSYGATS